ncbi:MAG: hypothetical protein HC822_16715 [Oscillochloris sp.]|nr:hypothetical protein [Oscillochloris sp.]
MARSLPETAFPRARRTSSALTLAGVGDLRPYLFLALLTLVALFAAYAVRPVVRIDLGGDHDSVFLRGFNGREIDAAGPAETLPWAPDSDSLTFRGDRDGVLMAVLRAAPDAPPDSLRQAAVAVNDIRVDMPRRTPDSIIASIPPDLADDPELRFTLVSPLVGDPAPPDGLVGEIALSPARTYRWSSGDATVMLPNLGRGTWVATFDLVAAHPDGSPLNARIVANDLTLAQIPETAAPRRIQLLVPPAALSDGSLNLEIVADTFNDPRPLGVLFSDITIAPAGPVGITTALPPFGGLALALLIVLGAYASLALAIAPAPQMTGRVAFPAHWWAAAMIGLTAILGAWALGTYRFPSSLMLPRLAWLIVWSLVLTLALRPLLAWLFRSAGMPAERAAGGWFLPALLLIFMLGYWLKAVGMIFPYFVAIDVQWHMERSRWILDGQLPLLYSTNSPLNETTMPTAEWGSNRPVIPYSPWYHMFATLFAFAPMSMEMAANMWSLLLDATRVLMIALIARKAGLSARASLIAAATYAVIPVSFLLHSWGNVPTTFGLWLTMAATVIIYCWWDRLHKRVPMLLLSLLLFFTFLIYTVTGVFMGFFLIIFTLLIWLNGMRGGEWAVLRGQLRPLWIASGVAIGLALIVYYGQYIPPIIQTTIPYMSTVFTQGPESVGVVRPPFSQYMWGYVPHLDYRIWPGDYLFYGIAIPMLFTIPGFFALRNRPLIWLLFATWFSVAVLFMFAGYRISMVDKQLFYLLPVMCICWAIYADRFWVRGRWGRVLVLTVLIYSLVTALDQWVLRIVTSPVLG